MQAARCLPSLSRMPRRPSSIERPQSAGEAICLADFLCCKLYVYPRQACSATLSPRYRGLHVVTHTCALSVLRCRYEACTLEAEALRLPYEALARLINCSPSEIAVVCGATQAWTQVHFRKQAKPQNVSMIWHVVISSKVKAEHSTMDLTSTIPLSFPDKEQGALGCAVKAEACTWISNSLGYF